MRIILFFVFLGLTNTIIAQKEKDCNQLSIEFRGIVKDKNSNQLLFEVSNHLYTGTLYYYPGFVLLDEKGDTIAKEEVKYYGIGTNFQIHLLELKKEISFPFEGTLKLYGSYYQNFFCEYSIGIEDAENVSLEEIRNESVKIGTNMANDKIILDIGGTNPNEEKIEYLINVTNEFGKEVHRASLDSELISIPVNDIGGTGFFIVSIWDAVNKKLLPAQAVLIE